MENSGIQVRYQDCIGYNLSSESSEYEYCGHIHWDKEENLESLTTFIKERFEIFLAYYCYDKPIGKNSEHLHIQWYGVTKNEWTKSDDGQWRKNGLYYKYLRDIKCAFSKSKCKGTREQNINYVLKSVPIDKGILGWNGAYITSQNLEIYVGKYETREQKESRIKSSMTFEQRIVIIWQDGGRPTTPETILECIMGCNKIPWSKFDDLSMTRIVNFLWHKSGNNLHEMRERVLNKVYKKETITF